MWHFEPVEPEKNQEPHDDEVNKIPVMPVVKIIKESLRHCRRPEDDQKEQKDADLKEFVLKTAIEYGMQEAVKLTGKAILSLGETLKRKNPGWVVLQVYQMAQRNKGEVTVLQVISELSVSEHMAKKVLRSLVEKKVCLVKTIEGTQNNVYIFPSFKKKHVVKTCAYCGSRFRARDGVDKCPNCQAPLKGKTSISL